MTTRPGPLGQALATELRAELGRQQKSKRWLADQIGQPHNTVNRWLAGESNPGVDHVDEMCRALGFCASDLLTAVQAKMGLYKSPHRRRVSDFTSGLALAV